MCPPVRPSACLSGRLSASNDVNALRISTTYLKFGGMMQGTAKKIAIKYGHARPIFARSTERLHNRQRP